MPLNERIFDELCRVSDLWAEGCDFIEVDARVLLMFDLQSNLCGFNTEPPRLSEFEF
jgi:hypothetical protein